MAGVRSQDPVAIVRDYRQKHEAAIVRQFAELLKYPNRARDTKDIEAAAAYIRDQLKAVGVASDLLRVDGAPPIVYGELLVPGATRTLGIYVHYDGQPVDPTQWTHPPFEPTLYTGSMDAGGKPRPLPRDGEPVDPQWRLYARSAGDDKAPIAALLPVLRAFRENSITPTSNVIFFFDGEEEAGSPHLEQYLRQHRDRLDRIDIWLFFDGPVHQSGRPQITFGVRGAMSVEVTVYGATRSLHSGHYGNWAPDTPAVLARLLASMKDEEGRVLIAGWYDTVEPIGDEERAALRAMPDYDAELRRELGLAANATEAYPASLPERLLLPALTIRGLGSGNTGELAANVIPSTATASLGIRLVKGNTPAHMRELVVRHIEKQGFHVVSGDPDLETRLKYPRIAKVTGGTGGSPAARTSMANPFAQQVVRAATGAANRAFHDGALILAPGMGGTLPLHLFTDVAGKPAVIVPIANHDNNQHAANENLRLANLRYAIDLYAALLTMPR
jgi:acetylornithine deacetylase/succinyl-diaminopimelate desuccinylase-like protein